MPPRTQVFKPNFAWRLALAEFPRAYGLSHLYQILVPEDQALPRLAHRAEPDVKMLFILTRLYFEGTLKPATRQKITSYLSQT